MGQEAWTEHSTPVAAIAVYDMSLRTLRWHRAGSSLIDVAKKRREQHNYSASAYFLGVETTDLAGIASAVSRVLQALQAFVRCVARTPLLGLHCRH